MTGDVTSRQIVPKSPACPEGLFLMDGIEGLRSLPKHSVDMLLTDPPYGTTRNFWDVPLPLPELWEAVKWAVKPDGAVLFFAQCPYDKVLGASNLSMLRYEWVWYKSRCTGFLNARRAPLKRTENILVFYQKLPYYDPQFEQGKPYKKISRTGDNSPQLWKIPAFQQWIRGWPAFPRKPAGLFFRTAHHPPNAETRGVVRVSHQNLYPARGGGGRHLRWLRHDCCGCCQYAPPLCML